MSRIRGTKSSAALIVAVIALVAALGGGAVAGVTISKLNNKEKKQVKRLSKKQAKKLDRKIELKPGPEGEQGPQGEQGPKGDQGAVGVSGYERVKKELSVTLSATGSQYSSVECPGTKEPLGGGVRVTGATEPLDDVSQRRDVRLLETAPLDPPSRKWAGGIRNVHGGDLEIDWEIWAVCANVE